MNHFFTFISGAMVSLDPRVHGSSDLHGCPLFRGELMLTQSEYEDVTRELVSRGIVDMKLDLVRTPEMKPLPSPYYHHVPKRQTSSSVALSPASVPSARMPQKRVRKDESVQDLKPISNLTGWRAIVWKVCDELLASDGSVERESIAYWFSDDSPP